MNAAVRLGLRLRVTLAIGIALGFPSTELLGQPAEDVLVDVRVVDAESDMPITSFRVLPGVPFSGTEPDDLAVWQPHLIREAVDGSFQWPKKRSYREFRLRFEAKGYKPAVTRWLKRDAGQQSVIVRMKLDPGVPGQVLSPKGEPAAGAALGISMPNRTVRLNAEGIAGMDDPPPVRLSDQWRRPRIFLADDQGRFQLDTETTYCVVVVVHESGLAEVSFEELRLNRPVQLQPWGEIDGLVRWHDVIGGGETISVSASRSYEYPEMLGMSATVETDRDGRFRLKVPPGRVQISRQFPFEDGKGSYLFPYLHPTISGDKPNEIVLGGDGIPVVGSDHGTGFLRWNFGSNSSQYASARRSIWDAWSRLSSTE